MTRHCTGCQKSMRPDEIAWLKCKHYAKLGHIPFHVQCLLNDARTMYAGDPANHIEADENMEAVYDYFIDQP